MCYFISLYSYNRIELLLFHRQVRLEIFDVGDVVGLYFRTKLITSFFEGICLAKKKSLTPNFSFILRNALSKVNLELNVTFHYNRTFLYRINDFKRKVHIYRMAKLYQLRNDNSFLKER